jgi:uncharacterized repeat protein (TIGR03847 family)
MTADFGTARAIDARAHGQPGARTFQLRIIGSNNESASLWMEKQQMQALSLALTQVLSQLGKPPRTGEEIASFPDGPDHDFRVGRMAIGFDTANGTVVLHAFEVSREEEEEGEEPDVQVRITADACAGLNSRLQEIIAGGRPVCPLCSVPMDSGGHACIRSNGHSEQPIPDNHVDDEESQQ